MDILVESTWMVLGLRPPKSCSMVVRVTRSVAQTSLQDAPAVLHNGRPTRRSCTASSVAYLRKPPALISATSAGCRMPHLISATSAGCSGGPALLLARKYQHCRAALQPERQLVACMRSVHRVGGMPSTVFATPYGCLVRTNCPCAPAQWIRGYSWRPTHSLRDRSA